LTKITRKTGIAQSSKAGGGRLVARVCTLDRLIFPQGGFPLDVDLFAVDQTRRFVGLF
jgi:hypothetical protein